MKNLTGLFKRIFKDDTEGITRKEEEDVINSVASQLMAQNAIVNEDTTVDTNKLPEFSQGIDAEIFSGFRGYMFYSCSNPGMVRKNNQDSTFTVEYKYYIADRSLCAGMAIVADGMGGLSMGEIASSTAIASVSTYMNARLSEYIQDIVFKGLPHGQVILGHIGDAMVNANTIVWDRGAQLGEQIGTTFTGAFFLGNVAYFGHVGDSRAYIIDIESKSMEKVTRDHSLVGRLVEMGHITAKDAKNHPRRNEIYKMLGLRKEIEVDTYYRIINKNCVILIMSDGLWEFVDENDMLNHILGSTDLSRSAQTIIDLANKNGGYDNISLVIVKPFE